jgi:hypothetical protein
MFVVSEKDAAAIRTAFDQGGELSAAVELRRLFRGITDNDQARTSARTIAGWKPLPLTPRPATRLHRGRDAGWLRAGASGAVVFPPAVLRHLLMNLEIHEWRIFKAECRR